MTVFGVTFCCTFIRGRISTQSIRRMNTENERREWRKCQNFRQIASKRIIGLICMADKCVEFVCCDPSLNRVEANWRTIWRNEKIYCELI